MTAGMAVDYVSNDSMNQDGPQEAVYSRGTRHSHLVAVTEQTE